MRPRYFPSRQGVNSQTRQKPVAPHQMSSAGHLERGASAPLFTFVPNRVSIAKRSGSDGILAGVFPGVFRTPKRYVSILNISNHTLNQTQYPRAFPNRILSETFNTNCVASVHTSARARRSEGS
jgi:hypothetical protein